MNPLNFQGIIFILNLGSVNLVFVRSSSTLSRDKDQSSNDKYRQKNPFRDGNMSIKINFLGDHKDSPQTLCTGAGLPFLCHTQTKPPAKHPEQWETPRNSWLGIILIPCSLNSHPVPCARSFGCCWEELGTPGGDCQ